MAVPKRKTSPSRRGMRRSADALKRPTYVEDKDSGELRRPHHIDLKTGMYKGRQVLKAEDRGVSRAEPGIALSDRTGPTMPQRLRRGEQLHVPDRLSAAAHSVRALQHGRLPAGHGLQHQSCSACRCCRAEHGGEHRRHAGAARRLLLYVEILKATRLVQQGDHGPRAVVRPVHRDGDRIHRGPRAATSTFLILMALSFVDVIGGFTITIRTAQRDIALERPESTAADADAWPFALHRQPRARCGRSCRAARPHRAALRQSAGSARRRGRVCGASWAVAIELRQEGRRRPGSVNAVAAVPAPRPQGRARSGDEAAAGRDAVAHRSVVTLLTSASRHSCVPERDIRAVLPGQRRKRHAGSRAVAIAPSSRSIRAVAISE